MIYNFEQRTPEWYEIRLGKFTASTANDLFMKPDTLTYKKLIYRKAYERVIGKSPEEPFITDAMIHGIETEDEARIQFEIDNLLEVKQVGFVTEGNIGCSPDGLVGDNELIEIKCPQWNTQIDYLAKDKVPLKYFRQMQFQMLITERSSCYFYSYHSELPAFQKLVKRDDEAIQDLKRKLGLAEMEVLKVMEVISGNIS